MLLFCGAGLVVFLAGFITGACAARTYDEANWEDTDEEDCE